MLPQALTVLSSPWKRGRISGVCPRCFWQRGVRLMYVTYSDLIQIGLLVCAIISLFLTYKTK